MRKFKSILAMVVLAGAGMAAQANAAAITLNLRIQSIAGVDLVPVSGVYQLTPNTDYAVVLSATVTSPNLGEASHGTMASQPLGIQTFTADLITSGTNNAFVPVGGAGSPPPWTGPAFNFGSNDIRGDGLVYSPINVLNKDGDSDLDVGGAGMVNVATSVAVNANASTRALVQYGVNGNNDLIVGVYHTNASGTGALLTNLTGAVVYTDPADLAPAQNLGSQDVLSGSTNGSINFTIVPEPGSIGLMSIAGLGLLARRRRLA
jgi:hypothetical protein